MDSLPKAVTTLINKQQRLCNHPKRYNGIERPFVLDKSHSSGVVISDEGPKFARSRNFESYYIVLGIVCIAMLPRFNVVKI
jgi:ABC-type branched-subunit amino acid transport system permease subunit